MKRMVDGAGADVSGDDSRPDLTQALSHCRSSLELRLSIVREDEPLNGALDVLRADVSDFASRSRRLDVPPERVLVSFKDMVRHLPAVQRWDPIARDAVMRELVQMTIEAYYSNDQSDG